MKKLNTSPISGTLELLPEDQAIFDRLKLAISTTYKTHGFLNIETPILERTEILFAKAGGDTEKQIYEVKKTGEPANQAATEALRFDHTVPLSRYIVEHENDLTFPFKVSQIGRNFRGERAQKGRFRELYQCDIDIIGRDNLPIFYDADIIATLIDTYSALNLNASVLARISNRKILRGVLEALNLQEKSSLISNIIDHAEKVSPEKTSTDLTEIGLTDSEKSKILQLIDLSGSFSTIRSGLESLGISNSTLDSGISELLNITQILDASGHSDKYIIDFKIIRGLDYYTGTVFEFFMPEHREVGSIGGGGRYDNLTAYFSDQKFPGVGGSIGLSRLFYLIKEHSLLNTTKIKPTNYAVIPISTEEIPYALTVKQELIKKGSSVTLVVNEKKLGDKLKYASKIATNAIVIGESEVASHSYEIKHFD